MSLSSSTAPELEFSEENGKSFDHKVLNYLDGEDDTNEVRQPQGGDSCVYSPVGKDRDMPDENGTPANKALGNVDGKAEEVITVRKEVVLSLLRRASEEKIELRQLQGELEDAVENTKNKAVTNTTQEAQQPLIYPLWVQYGVVFGIPVAIAALIVDRFVGTPVSSVAAILTSAVAAVAFVTGCALSHNSSKA